DLFGERRQFGDAAVRRRLGRDHRRCEACPVDPAEPVEGAAIGAAEVHPRGEVENRGPLTLFAQSNPSKLSPPWAPRAPRGGDLGCRWALLRVTPTSIEDPERRP